MAKTVKKKKLTVKTVKGSPASPNDELQSAINQGGAQAPQEAAPAQAAAAAPQAAAVPQGKQASYVLAGVFAIISTVMWIALILLQVMEWDHLSVAFPRM